ncbi:glycoside hydrolase family 68 protein [Halobacillus sp. Nhm2S1]|uniref:glycoside hydrolase family 68 protein n=1 Tax=Halobacillus sp. Nhm2S1 TaxID=2866716 RepID=UPI001C7332EB|nr:glycoside hydrolase family 68 protein [Halobacillus sp. Nhm2S1]MBX0359530.1 glycoside hydrolase family 68 protein [Halobacillus sp. Nhm2S1]
MNTRSEDILKKVWLISALFLGLLPAFASTPAQADEEGTPAWSRQEASQIERTDDNTAPYISQEEIDQMAPNHWVWDTWPLRNRDGSVATVKGYKVIFALTAPDDVLPGKRHDMATIRYFYSKNGQDWKMGGEAFDTTDAYGSRQWAGSAMVEDDGSIHLFYTATGRKGNEQLTYEQRLALANGEMEVTKDGIEFSDWSHDIILTPDGEYYQTEAQSEGGILYSFRDPWFFEDKHTGETYITFEGNSAGQASDQVCQPRNIGDESFQQTHEAPDGSAEFNGNVGLAVSKSEDLTEWEALPPVLEADCVNQQLERPHFVMKGNQYYLFVDSHKFTFAPGIQGPDGLYGFTADSLYGNYEPLNGSGLVVANPEDNPFQAYSWIVLPNGKVISFINFVELGDVSLVDVGSQPESFQYEHFGGTLAPTLKLKINKNQTQIIKELDDGRIK